MYWAAVTYKITPPLELVSSCMMPRSRITAALPPAATLAVSKALDEVYQPLVKYLLGRATRLTTRPLIVGISGGQGSGKTTTTKVLQSLITTNTSRRCIGISLDDFYLSAEGRARKANDTGIEALSIRGPPGTHQTQRLLKVLARLHDPSSCNHELVLPRFDKALDTTVEDETFPALRPGDIFLLEGWCVAAPPPPTDESTAALNSLDADLRFREFVDEELRGDYSEIWSQLDVHIHLQVPSWTCVLRWRQDQEDELRRKVGGDGIDVKEFCRGYERITRRMLKSCPDEADAVIFLGEDHSIAGCKIRN